MRPLGGGWGLGWQIEQVFSLPRILILASDPDAHQSAFAADMNTSKAHRVPTLLKLMLLTVAVYFPTPFPRPIANSPAHIPKWLILVTQSWLGSVATLLAILAREAVVAHWGSYSGPNTRKNPVLSQVYYLPKDCCVSVYGLEESEQSWITFCSTRANTTIPRKRLAQVYLESRLLIANVAQLPPSGGMGSLLPQARRWQGDRHVKGISLERGF